MTMEPFVHWYAWLLWGLVGTALLTLISEIAQGMRLSRMSLPYVLGTFVSANRDRALVAGMLLHFAIGLVFAFVYIAAFHALGGATWWRGTWLGLLHAALLLTAGCRALPGLHPRMASEQQEPTEIRALEPPGFLALNYGHATPLVVIFEHVVFGFVLGTLYVE
jgi:hypothetical protein